MVSKWECYSYFEETDFMAEHLFERLARERGITVKEMRVIISDRIGQGISR